MKLPDHSGNPPPGCHWLPGVKRKAETMQEYIDWATSKEMGPVFDRLASEAMRMKEVLGPTDLAGKRGIWLLLAVEAVCRQQSAVRLESDIEEEMAEGVNIISEMVLGAAGEYGKPEPLKMREFWRDVIQSLCMTWGGPATMLNLDPHHLYAVQIRKMRDAPS